MLYFIVNETSRSGKGESLWENVKRILEKKGIEYKSWITEYKGHAMELAREICSMEDDDIRLVVLGGDGTINEAINGMHNFEKVKFGIIPNGSGNDFGRGYGLPNSAAECLKIILKSKNTDSIDIGKVTYDDGQKTKLFAISSGIGMDALVCKHVEKSKIKKILNKVHLGKLTYLVITVKTLFTMNTSDVKIVFDEDKHMDFSRVIFLASMNFRAEGGGVPMSPKADAKDGKLSVCTAHGVSKFRAFTLLPFLVMAKHSRFKAFDIIDCEKCKVSFDEPMALHTDGEYLGDYSEVYYESLPSKLNIMM